MCSSDLSGAVALMLQANPGLTPPLIKAILQYTAQPVADASLVQQGAGQLNVDGAVTIAQTLRTDLSSAIASGSLASGASMLAAGNAFPSTTASTIAGTSVPWGRLVLAGGSQLLSGNALFTASSPFTTPGCGGPAAMPAA